MLRIPSTAIAPRKSRKRHIDEDTLVHRFTQDTSNEPIPIQAMGCMRKTESKFYPRERKKTTERTHILSRTRADFNTIRSSHSPTIAPDLYQIP